MTDGEIKGAREALLYYDTDETDWTGAVLMYLTSALAEIERLQTQIDEDAHTKDCLRRNHQLQCVKRNEALKQLAAALAAKEEACDISLTYVTAYLHTVHGQSDRKRIAELRAVGGAK